MTKTKSSYVRICREVQTQAIHVARESTARNAGECPITEPVKVAPLRDLLAQWTPITEEFPDIDDFWPEGPVEL